MPQALCRNNGYRYPLWYDTLRPKRQGPTAFAQQCCNSHVSMRGQNKKTASSTKHRPILLWPHCTGCAKQ